MITLTVLGLGEAGTLYATGLSEAGAVVRGYDPFVDTANPLFTQSTALAEAVENADVVISLVGADAAAGVAAEALPRLSAGTVFADFNTSSPAAKQTLARAAAAAGIPFVDVAVLAPVPRSGSGTSLMASGPGSERFRDLVAPLGVPVEAIPGEAGVAAARKLLRSVFMKGLASVVLESVAAGRAADDEDWIRDQMAQELGPHGADLVERLVTGSHAHAARRAHEVQDDLDYVHSLGTPSWMTEGTLAWLSSLAASPIPR
ncbi:NAD(P)-binding domain-containing protein [Leifsonia sp. Root112D2]|uniref:NAD(P)-binding domain-containing protein n=1 Tax=Leifsonia sp. Root112D2 TaxID=1736426 RepID=UPI0006F43BA3|nr:NAD(P)-dependent oxidoreductase [Leifsonia sp. Root112D2]KQV06495.1 hypothetical protein ASC63_03425 [Leifsonia sp. Root112D2]